MVGNVLFVRYQYHGIAAGLYLAKDLHDLDGGLGIEVTGRLISQYEGRGVHQGAGNGYPLVCPPDNSLGLWWLLSSSPTCLITSMAISVRRFLGTPA